MGRTKALPSNEKLVSFRSGMMILYFEEEEFYSPSIFPSIFSISQWTQTIFKVNMIRQIKFASILLQENVDFDLVGC